MKRLLSPPIDGVFSSILANREALDSIRKYCLRLLEQCERSTYYYIYRFVCIWHISVVRDLSFSTEPIVAVRDAILLEAVRE